MTRTLALILGLGILSGVLYGCPISDRHKTFVRQEQKFVDRNIPRLIKYLEADASLPDDVKKIEIETARQHKQFVDKEIERIEKSER